MTQMRDTERLLRERIRDLQEQLEAKERLLDLMGHSLEEQLEAARAEAERSEKYAEERDLVAQEFERELDFKKKALRHCRKAHLASEERKEAADRALRAIHFNASSWHAGEDSCRRALNVIQAWAAHPESIPEGVGEVSSPAKRLP